MHPWKARRYRNQDLHSRRRCWIHLGLWNFEDTQPRVKDIVLNFVKKLKFIQYPLSPRWGLLSLFKNTILY
jgi:hypothetical protein